MSSDEKNQKIEANLILEVLGKPPKHLVDTLKDLIKKIGEEKGIKIKDNTINEPSPVKEHKGFYSTFAEIEVEAEGIPQMVGIIFKYMPSHIEFIFPENISMPKNIWNEVFNELTRRLHAYDEVARVIQNEKIILEKKLKEIIGKEKKSPS